MKKSLAKTAAFLIIFLLSNFAFSQQDEYINGRLLDAKTQEPIAFASIRIKDRALGIISNSDGSFKIPLKYKEYGDIIEISSMGYQTKEILIHDFSIYELNNVILQPATLELEEAVVSAKKKRKRKLTAMQIVQKAIEEIPNNYALKPFSTVGYYRDYQIEKEEYVNLNEAIVEVFDQGFRANDTLTTRTRIYDYSPNDAFRRDTLSDKPYDYKDRSKIIVNGYMSGSGGNEFSTLKVHDAIRNYQLNTYDFINNMKEGDVLEHHSFNRTADVYLDKKVFYVIEFTRKEYAYFAKGRIFISKNDFAIQKLEYAVYDTLRSNNDEKSNALGIKGKLIFDVVTEYKRNENDKMFLNYISFHNTFQLREPPKFTLKFIDVNMEQNYFTLTFNNRINSKNALDNRNYVAFFQGEIIKFERSFLSRKQVFIYPKLNTGKQIAMWQGLKKTGVERAFKEKLIYFDVKNIRDIEGNLINEPISKEYNQFREFFVQEVKLNVSMPRDSLFMNKRKPIFKNQPIVKPDNFDDYWMNTPLQNIEN